MGAAPRQVTRAIQFTFSRGKSVNRSVTGMDMQSEDKWTREITVTTSDGTFQERELSELGAPQKLKGIKAYQEGISYIKSNQTEPKSGASRSSNMSTPVDAFNTLITGLSAPTTSSSGKQTTLKHYRLAGMLSAFIDKHATDPSLSQKTETLQTLLAKTKPSQSDIDTLNEALKELTQSLKEEASQNKALQSKSINTQKLNLALQGHMLLQKHVSVRGEDLLNLFPRHFNTQFQHMLLKSKHKTQHDLLVLQEQDKHLTLEHS